MDDWRQQQLVKRGHLSNMASLTWSELQLIELFPGVALGEPIICVPELYLPPGTMRRPASRRRDPSLGGKLFAGVPNDVALQRNENVRRALLVLWLPHDGKRGGNGLGPSSWLTYTALLLRAVSWVIDSAPLDLGNIWLPLHQDGRSIFRKITKCERSRRDLETISQRLKRGAERGLLPDFLQTVPMSVRPIRALEQSHRQPKDDVVPAHRQVGNHKAAENKHFDDDFVVEIIGRASWILDNIADKCIECWSATEEAGRSDPSLSYDQIKARKNAIVSRFDWSDGEGNHLSNLPFKVRQRTDHQRYSLTEELARFV